MRLSLIAYLCGAAALMAMAAGCGRKASSETSDSSKDSSAEMVEETREETPIYFLTSQGVGAEDAAPVIATGMPVADIPVAVEGLYDDVRRENHPEYTAYVFSIADADGHSEDSFRAIDFGERKVDLVQLLGTRLRAHTPKGEIALGQSFRDVLALPSVAPIWEGEEYEREGTWFWVCDGLYFQPAHDKLPEQLVARLFDDSAAPVLDDFPPEVEIGMIATGLAF